MGVAVVRQLVLPWVFCLPFLRNIWPLDWDIEGLAQGPGYCTYLLPPSSGPSSLFIN